jgi:hypothetical protein
LKLFEELIKRDLGVIISPFDLNTFIDSGFFLHNYLAATEDLRIANCQSLFENLKVNFSFPFFSINKCSCMIIAHNGFFTCMISSSVPAIEIAGGHSSSSRSI